MRKTITSLLLAMAVPAQALITYHKSEPIYSDSWARGLEKIINHKARLSGSIGPLGPSARFQFAGNAAVFNEVLDLYARVQQARHTLYLTTSATDSDFELSVNHDGSGYLHLCPGDRIHLGDLKLPPGVSVEALPDVSHPLDPELLKQKKKMEQEINAFVQSHARPTSSLSVGAEFPEMAALAVDGNAINAQGPWPRAFTGKTVLLMAWSVKNPPTLAQLDQLQSIRKQQPESAVQLASLCIDSSWEEWLGKIQTEKWPNSAGWWQVFENPSLSASQKNPMGRVAAFFRH